MSPLPPNIPDGGLKSAATLADAVQWLARVERLPVGVESKARLLLLDTFGCLLAGLVHPEVTRFGRALQPAFTGRTSWPTTDIMLGPAGLAALGAAAACWDEACEGNSVAHGRPGLPVVPALLALSASQDMSLGQLLLALATGYEIGARAGEMWRILPGWHVDGSWHSLGVAAAVAHFTAGTDRIQPAIEAAACQIPSSLYLPIAVGSVVRNTYPAHAVLLGMMSAAAAAAGFEMPPGALEEARQRVLRTTTPGHATTAGQWMILEGYLKPFAGVRHTHYGVEAALRLRKRHSIAPERVQSIRLQTYAEAVQYCGNRTPISPIQAQFSLSYAIAAALVLGDLGPRAYTDIADPTIRRLEQLVVVEVEPGRSGRGARVTIAVNGAQHGESVEEIAGDPSVPMTEEQVVGKFNRYTERILDEKDAGSLVRFFLEGDSALPARACFTFGRS